MIVVTPARHKRFRCTNILSGDKMSQKQTVLINGREYDKHTGLPVYSERASRSSLRHAPAPAISPQPAQASTHASKQSTPSQQIHRKTQKSVTLNRKFTKKPTATPHMQQVLTKNAPRLDGMVRTRAPKATAHHLAPQKQHPQLQPAKQPAPVAPSVARTDIHRPHPVQQRAHAAQSAKRQAVQTELPTASVLKQAAINEAMDSAPKHHAKQHAQARSPRSRILGVVFGCFALVLFGGYLTYLNVPNLSVRVAAAQAGIDASYPGYRPDGYRLDGPVAFSNGEVRMQFAANTGETGFTLNQAKSSWDSSALLENFVRNESKDEYTTSQEKGITIYSFDGDAAWVSGGILYTIDGDAPLSPDQIRKIATSV